MKEQNGSEKKKVAMNKEKKFYLFTAIGCAAMLMAIIVLAVVLSNTGNVNAPSAGNNPTNSSAPSGDVNVGGGNTDNNETPDEPVVNVPEGMVMPLGNVSIVNDFGFYHNKTLNSYYEHTGVDFAAEVGAQVLAVDDGVVENIFRDDVLTGTEIIVDHGDGVKTLYRFVNAVEGLSVGDKVKKGDVIATVAEATGEEYKDGAHLHFEISKKGACVDPATELTFEEK